MVMQYKLATNAELIEQTIWIGLKNGDTTKKYLKIGLGFDSCLSWHTLFCEWNIQSRDIMHTIAYHYHSETQTFKAHEQ